MKLNWLHIVGFQGVHLLEIGSSMPVIVVSGPNASGKSSLRDAIQFALDGDSTRCKLKKNYGTQLVNDRCDKKNAIVTLQLDEIEYQRKVATGESMLERAPDFPALLPWLIGTARVPDADHKDLQRIFTVASGIKMSHKQIYDRLLDLGANQQYVDHIKTYLRAGFASALKETKSKMTEARGEWKGITGETFGVEKARSWRPQGINVPEQTAEIQVVIDGLRKQRAEHVLKRNGLAPTNEQVPAGHIPSHNYVDLGKCPGCGVELRKSGHILYVKDGAAEAPKPDTSRAVETRESVDRLISTTDIAIGREEGRLKQVIDQAAQLGRKADDAARVNQGFEQWKKLAELLSPDGLPKTIIAEALKPINERMLASSVHTDWPITVVSPDLEIIYAGRLYALLSESEKWRANAVISEALAFVSGIKLFVLDRMDILEPSQRAKFIEWISVIKADHDTIMIMATLKQEPPMPYGFTSVWLG